MIQETLYRKDSTSKSNSDLQKFYKEIYKILHESIVPKVGGTDHVSHNHKYFTFYVGKGVCINVK
jgi:hypothetical protein